MTMNTPISASAFVQQLRTIGSELLDALNLGDVESVTAAQRKFSGAIDAAWQYFNRPEVPAREKALPRLIERWAQGDLPKEISDPANYPAVARELKLLLSSLVIFE
jgi:hypothetical protein